MKILKIGTFSKEGWPQHWHLDLEDAPAGLSAIADTDSVILTITDDGRVLVKGIEIVEWTEARQAIM